MRSPNSSGAMFALLCLCAVTVPATERGAFAGETPPVARQPSGQFIAPGRVAAIPSPPDMHPMFTRWLIGEHQPTTCRFSAQPNMVFQVFVGLSEAYWDRPGQRLMDIEIAGKVVATVDSFHEAKGLPSGYLFPASTDARGRLEIRVCPHPGAPDQNTVVCGLLLFPAGATLDVNAIIHNRGPMPLASVLAGDRVDNFAGARFVNNRVDNDLVADMGTCQVDDFRFFTMLHQDAWDMLRWETLGNAVMEHRTWRNWPYEQRLRVTVDGSDMADSAQVEQVEQQFDFRQVSVVSPALRVARLDMMESGRQWTTALRLTNVKDKSSKVVVEAAWTSRSKGALDVQPWSDGDGKGFAYALKGGPLTLVSTDARGNWEKQGEDAVRNHWEVELKAGEATTLTMNAHIGWTAMPAYRDNGPGTCGTIEQATADRRADTEGFRRVTAALGASSVNYNWPDLQNICEARRHYLYDRMPQLQGFDPTWMGMWSYTFDLLRSGVYPAQANFKDVWLAGDLVVYREPFCWDGPLSVHTFCNWDADLSARTLRTFLSSTKADGELCVSANPYRAFNNPTPQLANNAMALWDCYQITHDKAVLADCYPLIVRHVRWLETKRNHTPNGPLMDVGYNMDYGVPSFYSSPTLWVDVQMFLVDRYRRLAKIATVLDKPKEEIAEWTDRANRLADGIRAHMWDDKNGTFWCVSDKLEFKSVSMPVEFFSMTTGVATPQQARKLVARLIDPAKYAPSAKYPFVLPSVAFDDPHFNIKDGWCGSIWPVQTYYTVRGLADYGYQAEAAALSTNLYGMMAQSYRETGTIFEQYDPRNGKDLGSSGCQGVGVPEIGRGYFTSGITTTVLDMLLRGVFGFERTDEPLSFRLNPRPLNEAWHGVDNLVLNTGVRMDLSIRKAGEHTDCRLHFTGLGAGAWKLVLTKKDGSNARPLENGSVAFSCDGASAIRCRLQQ